MNLVSVYLWLCCGVAVLASLVFGIITLVGGPGNRERSKWPLFTWVTVVCLALQSGYLFAPLAASADGPWWRWAVAGMAPIAFLSAVAVGSNLWLWTRLRISGGGGSGPLLSRLPALGVLAAVYVAAPVVLWCART